MLTVDPWHWLTEDGHFLVDKPRLYRRMLRIARFIEYGETRGPLRDLLPYVDRGTGGA